MINEFNINVDDYIFKDPNIYYTPKIHKIPWKAEFIITIIEKSLNHFQKLQTQQWHLYDHKLEAITMQSSMCYRIRTSDAMMQMMQKMP